MEPEIQEIDAQGWTIQELQTALAGLPDHSRIRIQNLSSDLPGIGAGIDRKMELTIDGNAGPFAFMLARQTRVEIIGKAGIGCGHSLHSGSILIRSDCGSFLAAYALGGFVAVHGRAGDCPGFGLSGGEVVIRSSCGHAAGAEMKSGTLVLGNGAGKHLGLGMVGGTIFFRGGVESLGDNVRTYPIKDADSLRLGLLLARAGLKTRLSEFQMLRAK